ncbi:MAG: TetR/AcrR family transcriptional regulator [Acidimicrobiia bacterium]|nr:TetR/AcrR family transcriptional regulator [Acidimicrobiia bacterium]MBT8193557.1 TetR/AcrR family transcriptional regulator [Acidimicrobiia bacterium]MBT8248563.1 TetR/AcrR family transcriptional regulator [Acidimicrobiia bacterium]MBT8250459.1 TetR/AcrR family transcriptional regulator [Acidimicrobiia bacterium]NNF88902.1 TetR/AcrR family transcriptional regulator [Acidimicrobiia bacterium]
MARQSRREELLRAALEEFKEKGYEGTSVADIVLRTGMSKAAFGYHLETKEQLMDELVEPLLNDIEAALDGFVRHPSWPEEGRRLLSAYLDVLVEHRDLLIWVDADKAVLHHPRLGKRLTDSNQRLREAIRGDNRSAAARLGASAVLGTLWRPLRNLPELSVESEKQTILEAAMAVVTTVRDS